MDAFVKVAEAKDLAPGQAIAVEVAGRKIAIFNVDGIYYAIGDTCTHRGGALSEGEVQGTTVICPLHGANFDLATGNNLTPPAPEGVESFKVQVEGGDLKVEVP